MKRYTLLALLVPMLALAGTITQTFTFSPDEVSFTRVNGYDLPALRGYVSTSAPGEPIIPQAIFTFVVPANATVTNVEVVGSERSELAGSYRIHPAQTPRPLSKKEAVPFVAPNSEVYGSSDAFPGRLVEFGYTGTKTGYRLCGVSAFPLQYTPATGKVTLYTSLTLRVTYEENTFDAVPLTAKQAARAAAELESWVANPEVLKAFAPAERASDPVDAEYVIVTTDAYVSYLQPLADWHAKKGYPTMIKTVAWITANYTGTDNQEKIRNFIIDYYANHGTMFVLLAGGNSAIPARRGYSNVGGTTDNIPADLYYSDLQWSWNGNHNSYWGEANGDTVDFYADVIASTANATTFVNKVFAHEQAPNAAFIKKTYLPWVMLFSSQNYTGEPVSDSIAGITPSDWTDTKVNTPSTSTFQTAINNGYGYCHAAAHGDATGFYSEFGSPIYTTTQAGAQTNGLDKLVIMNSMACISGNFESQSCLSVTLQNNANGGSVANMMNSRYGWGTPPSMGPSEKLCVRFYDFFITRDSFTVGVAHARGKDVYASLPQGQEVWRWCFYDYNLLGDPGMPVWSNAPGTLTVTDPDSIFTGTQSVRVTVTSGGSPVANASVGLYKAGEVCVRGLTNSSGIADILVSPATVGMLYITVSAQDKLPVADSARVVTGVPVPYMVKQSVVVDDGGNGRVDPGETVNLWVTLRNAGNAAGTNVAGTLRTTSGYVTLVDSLANYGVVNAGDSARGDFYRLTAASGTPPGSVLSFTLHITATEGSWDAPFTLVAGQPQMPGALWANIDTANCLLSVIGNGAIGVTEPDGQGNGFKYPKTGVSKFYYGGFLVGNSASYIVDHYYGRPASSVNTDFRMVDSVRQTLPPDMGDEMLTSIMSDAGHSTPKSLRVTQRALQIANPGYDDFTILVYDIQNQGANAVDGCYAGIMTDFDIYSASGAPSDRGRNEPGRRHVWMRGSNSANPTLGLRVLSPQVASGLSLIDHDRYVYPDTAMTESMKYRFMSGALSAPQSNRNYDWSIVAATGPFDLAPGASQRVAFAMVGGTDSTNFIANSDSAQSWWDRMSGIIEPATEAGGVPRIAFMRLAPNPFSGATRVSYIMPAAGRLTVTAYDAGGRRVADILDEVLPAGAGAVTWQPRGLAGGVYFVKAASPVGVQTEKVLRTE